MKYDTLIIGGGPAAVSAALTLRKRNKTVAMIANPPETTALWKAEEIGNYPGASGKGSEMEQSLLEQAEKAGAEILRGRALSVMNLGSSFGVAVGNDFYEGSSIILCTGITRNSAYPGEEEFVGRGVSYCATCDGMLYKNKNVAVIGDSKEAEEDIGFLESIGCAVTHLKGSEKIEVLGGDRVEGVKINGEETPVEAVFVLKDTISVSKLVPGLSYENGAVTVDRNMATNLPGVFAAGDCTGKPYQVGKAVGEGNIAALSASSYVDEINK